jgi:phosphoglycolate phosphatase-like HAD superfamily hydrolase
VRAARANGTAAIGVLWGYGSREELADADRIVATPRELGQVFAASSA